MIIHIISETSWLTKGQGVDTAFVEHVALMEEKKDIKVVVNQEGYGDVLHSHTYGPYFFWKGRHYKGRKVFTVHVIPDSIIGSLPAAKLLFPFVKWYLRKVYSYADVCIAISPHVKKAIEDLGVKTPIAMISNPLNVGQWKRTESLRSAGRKKLGVTDKDFLVMAVGQIEGRKGVDDFIDIAESLPECKFVWVGGRPFGIMTEGILRLNRKIKKAAPKINFIGLKKLDEMPELYAAGDTFIFPSYQENCPLAPLEAAASGMPVIYRDLKEYESLYKNPYLKAKDNAEFIQLLKRIINDNAFRLEATSMSKKLLEQFDKNQIREELISLYESLVN